MCWKSEQSDVDRVSNPDRYGIKPVVSSNCGLRQNRNYTECHKTFTKSHSHAIMLQVSHITLKFNSDVKCLLCGFMVAINVHRAEWRVHSRCEIKLINASMMIHVISRCCWRFWQPRYDDLHMICTILSFCVCRYEKVDTKRSDSCTWLCGVLQRRLQWQMDVTLYYLLVRLI